MLTKKRIIFLITILAVIIITPILAVCRRTENMSSGEMQVITLWQIDSFEGGKGSRAQYLQNKANELFDGRNCYVTVSSLSAEAARKNMEDGNIPDIISYGAGFYGLDRYINASDFAYRTWCRGGYCLLTVSDDADFSDVSSANTVINTGKDNLYEICALFEGISGAAKAASTSAYVGLINGKYKYLLGTQRDIARLKTRGTAFSVKPLTQFNDLYQNFSILTKENKYVLCSEFTDYVVHDNGRLDKIGMFFDGARLYDSEMHKMEGVQFEYTLKSFVSENYFYELKNAAKTDNINLVKNLLK